MADRRRPRGPTIQWEEPRAGSPFSRVPRNMGGSHTAVTRRLSPVVLFGHDRDRPSSSDRFRVIENSSLVVASDRCFSDEDLEDVRSAVGFMLLNYETRFCD